MQKTAFLFAAGALVALAAHPAEAQVRRVRCESNDYRERLCRAETSGGVRLARQLGDAACREGRSWGTTRQGIWVSNGCRADFEVGRGRGGILDTWRGRTGNNGTWNRGSNGDWNRGSNGDWNRGSNGDWNRGSVGNASGRCRAAVASRIGTRAGSVDTWVRRQGGSSADLGWRAGRSNGTCRVDRNGRVSVNVDRNGYDGRDGYNGRDNGRDRDYDRNRDRNRDRDRDRDHRYHN
jgi:hypothetical protein